MKKLTYDQIMRLEGRELGMAIAQAKGIEIVTNLTGCVYYDNAIDALVYPGYWLKHGRFSYGGMIPLPNFQERAGYALGLCNDLRADGFDVDITFRPGLEHGCRIAPRGEINTKNVIFVSAPTTELAVFRAYVLLRHKQLADGE